MKSKVYFLKNNKTDLIKKTSECFAELSQDIILPNENVAVKLHFGEPGNTAYLKPKYVKPIIDAIKEKKANPFLTDANTLYKGGRSDTPTHLKSAKDHGYSFETMGAEIRIADGLDSHYTEKIAVNLKHFKEVSLAKLALESDSMVVLTHFKGHDATGFGGALKNVGMGFGSKAGKQQMHADIKPQVNITLCQGDAECVKWCPVEAITMMKSKAQIDLNKCIGCGECVAVCPTGAIAISWAGTPDSIQEKIAEYCYAILKNRLDKVVFINYIIDVSPNCDCWPKSDPAITQDIGILISNDIIAIDQASVDLVNSSKGIIENSDKFRALYPSVDWSVQLKYAEELKLGTREYELIEY